MAVSGLLTQSCLQVAPLTAEVRVLQQQLAGKDADVKDANMTIISLQQQLAALQTELGALRLQVTESTTVVQVWKGLLLHCSVFCRHLRP